MVVPVLSRTFAEIVNSTSFGAADGATEGFGVAVEDRGGAGTLFGAVA
jgi:hypothetical protein